MRISKRQQVRLQDVWPKETDFSNWLVSEDGLSLIVEDIGIQLENPKRESQPGDFRCDIVGHELGDENHVIVIENQYGKTNHDHLGKMLTYAAVHDATTGIWLTERASDDHRQVIDWLNNNTPPTVNFFLAEIKAYKIDDSPVAPQIEVVCRPNSEVKAIRENVSEAEKERRRWRSDFWEDVRNYIKEQNPPFNVPSPTNGLFTKITVGRGGFYIGLVIEITQPCIRCELCIRTTWRIQAFEELQQQRENIEREIGSTLEWLPLPEMEISRIRIKADINPKDVQNREQIKKWMNEQANNFYRVFQPRVQTLSADYVSSNDTNEDNEGSTDS